MTETDNISTSLPGFADVTDGTVDYFKMDWKLAETVPQESEMENSIACGEGISDTCGDNIPEQNDEQEYPIITE